MKLFVRVKSIGHLLFEMDISTIIYLVKTWRGTKGMHMCEDVFLLAYKTAVSELYPWPHWYEGWLVFPQKVEPVSSLENGCRKDLTLSRPRP
jgi:hypothetical protein